MALDKDYKEYYYNLGRTMAIVEIMNNLPKTFSSLVFDNAADKLPAQLTIALRKDRHNLHKELLDPADIVLNHGELPHKMLTSLDKNGRYWIGYYHEMAYLSDTYHGIFGNESTEVTENIPDAVASVSDNTVDELAR